MLINNLLDLQTHDQVATRFVPVRVDEIVRSVAEDLRPLAAAKQLSVDVELTTPITVKGAAELLLTRDTHPEAEIDKVTTPKGCTITGLNEMEHRGFSSSLIKGILSSYQKII